MRFWIGDGLVDEAEARVSVLDRGFLIGDAVFDTTTAVPGEDGALVPFALDRHLRRLLVNAAAIGLDMSADRVRTAMLAVCQGNPELRPGARLRVTLSTGLGPPARTPDASTATIVVIALEAGIGQDGIAAAVSPWPVARAGALAGVKSTSFGGYARALRWAASVGAGEALISSTEGFLVEGSTSNVLVILGGRVLTPDLGSGCLPGVTRELILMWSREAGIDVSTAPVPMSMLADADELLVTNAVRGVQRVVRLHDRAGDPVWAPGAIGLGERLQRLYRERSAQDPNP